MPENANYSLKTKPPLMIQDLIEALEDERRETFDTRSISKIVIALAIAKGFENFGTFGMRKAIIDA